jgi:hypothetical protein
MRTIVESNALARQFRQYKIDYQRWDEVFNEIQRSLRVAPETFPEVPGTGLRRVKIIGFGGLPRLSIFFTFDEHTVTLHFVARVVEEE